MEGVLDNIKREPPKVWFGPKTSNGGLNTKKDVDPLRLSGLPEYRSLRRDKKFPKKQEPPTLQSCSLEAGELRAAELHPDIDHQLVDLVKRHIARTSVNSKQQLTRSGKKPHVCETCGKKFPYNSTLMRHKSSHSGEMPYACDVCEERFKQNHHLALHKRCHLNVFKPYACDMCKAAYTKKSTLTKHKKCHSERKWHVCDTCGNRFVLKSDLYRHKKSAILWGHWWDADSKRVPDADRMS